MLEFNEKLNAATVTNLADYALIREKDGAKIEVYLAQLIDPKKIALLTSPLFKDIDYDLAVQQVGDVAEPSNLITETQHQAFQAAAGQGRIMPRRILNRSAISPIARKSSWISE